MIHLGLLGQNIKYSLSPSLHEMWGKMHHIPLLYHLFDSTKKDIPDLINALKKGQIYGLNVTQPYKEDVLAYVDEMEPLVATLQAANTLVRKPNGVIKAYNTDVNAIEMLLKPYSHKKNSVILGNGRSARAAYNVIKTFSHNSLTLVARNTSISEPALLPWSVLTADFFKEIDILVNATPLDLFSSSLPFTAMQPGSIVFNMPYQHEKKEFPAHLTLISGKEMLRLQAQAAFSLWFGIYHF